MFLKSLLFSIALLFSPIVAQEYSIKKISNTEIVRLKISESTKIWTCFDENKYREIAELSINSKFNDSLLSNYIVRLNNCQSNVSDLKLQLNLSQENNDILKNQNYVVLDALNTTSKKLQEQKIKTMVYSAVSGVVGFSIGAIVVMIAGN